MKLLTRAAVIGAIAAIGLGVSGCSTATSNCSNANCSISLSGEGANTDPKDVEFELVDATAGGEAQLLVAGQSVTCVQGETVSLMIGALTCTEVGDDSVKLDVVFS